MNYERIVQKIKEGCVIRSEHYYRENVTIYSIIKHNTATERTIFCEIARNIAFKLKKEENATIEGPIKCIASNFIPVPVKPGCVRNFFI